MFDSGANLSSELKSNFWKWAASNGGSHPKTQMFERLTAVDLATETLRFHLYPVSL